MAKNINHVSHIKSKQVVDGKPKLPSASSLVEGEIAINFAEGVETISTKNESGNVITFSSDDYYTVKKLGSGFTGENSGKTVTDVIVENEKIIASALINLDERKLDASAYTPTDLSNYYTKDETSGATEIQDALDDKVNVDDVVTAITPSNSGSTDPIATSVVAENEAVVANALTGINARLVTALEKANAALEALGGVTILKISQADYDALTTKDPNTLYVINE